MQEITQYNTESNNNIQVFENMLQAVRPDLFVLMERLDSSEINWVPILHVITQIEKITKGTKYGQVTVDIVDNVCSFVRGIETRRVQESATKI